MHSEDGDMKEEYMDKNLEDILATARTQAQEGKTFGILETIDNAKHYLPALPDDKKQKVETELQALEITAYKNAITRYLANAQKLAEAKQPVYAEAYLYDVERYATRIRFDVTEEVAKIRKQLKT